jgi:hypothetical protein
VGREGASEKEVRDDVLSFELLVAAQGAASNGCAKGVCRDYHVECGALVNCVSVGRQPNAGLWQH